MTELPDANRLQSLLCSRWVNRIGGAVLVGIQFGRLSVLAPTRSMPSFVTLMTGFAIIALFALWRRVPHAVTLQPQHWVTTFVCTGLGVSSSVFAWSNGVQLLPDWLLTGTLAAAAVCSLVSRVSLGRCFGLLPANRGVVTHGTYRFVRHPVFAAFLVAELALLAGRFSLPLLGMTLVMMMMICVRVLQEERFLGDDPAYQQYTRAVRYRLVPGLW